MMDCFMHLEHHGLFPFAIIQIWKLLPNMETSQGQVISDVVFE
jgi:hypothetical protein